MEYKDFENALARLESTLVGIAGVDENFLVLFEPVIDPVPIERQVILDDADLRVRVLIGPHGVFRNLAAHIDGKIRTMALPRAMAVVVRGRE